MIIVESFFFEDCYVIAGKSIAGETKDRELQENNGHCRFSRISNPRYLFESDFRLRANNRLDWEEDTDEEGTTTTFRLLCATEYRIAGKTAYTKWGNDERGGRCASVLCVRMPLSMDFLNASRDEWCLPPSWSCWPVCFVAVFFHWSIWTEWIRLLNGNRK